MDELKHMKQIYKEKRFKVISERMIEVDKQIVQRVVKKGRQVITCSCENSSTFAHSNLCRHKLFLLYLPLLKDWNERIDTLIDFYRNSKHINKTEEAIRVCGFYCSDLEELKR